jgi:mRNA interferase YafQ
MDLIWSDGFKRSFKKLELWSCTVDYDCRIIFSFSEDGEYLEVIILLIDIGSHDQVYRK